MLRKKTGEVAFGPRLSSALTDLTGGAIDRRTFLRRSGLAVGGLAAASTLSSGMVRKAEAASVSGAVEIKKSVCTHCSVGCTVLAETTNGVWVGQEPGYDSPFNLGAHCAKGAAVREHAHGERRLKYPTKLVDGKWQRVSWEEAINEIGDKMLDIREKSGPTRFTGWDLPSTTMSRPICSASFTLTGAPIMVTIRRVSVTRPRLPVLPTPGAMVR